MPYPTLVLLNNWNYSILTKGITDVTSAFPTIKEKRGEDGQEKKRTMSLCLLLP